MLRIAIVEDGTLFRKTLIAMLNATGEFTVVMEAECGKEFEEMYDPSKVDIILMDLCLNGQHGTVTASNLCKKYPQVKIIVLTNYDDPPIQIKLFEIGAAAFVTKDVEPKYLKKVIRLVHEHGYYFDKNISTEIIDKIEYAKLLSLKQNGKYLPDFSEVEMKICKLCFKGHTNTEIAEQLKIKVRTVESHKSDLFVKTNCKNMHAVMIYMLKNAIMFIDEF